MTSKRQFRAEVPARASATVANSSRNVAWIVFFFLGVDAYEKSAFSFTMVAAKAWDIGG